jgi:hypothetical protein
MLGSGVSGDPLGEPVGEPLRVGDVGVAALVAAGELEQAAEGPSGVGVLPVEGETLAETPSLFLPRRPVVLVLRDDLGKRGQRLAHPAGVVAELGEHGRHGLLVAGGGGEDRAGTELAHAVGNRLERVAAVVSPLGAEDVVHDLARVGREERRLMRPLGEPGCGQAGQQRLALGDAHEPRRAAERHRARGEQLLRLLGQLQQVETLGDEPLALPDEAGDGGPVAVLVGKALVGACLLDRVQVGADHVLGDGERQRLSVCLAHLGWHLLELRLPRRPVAALPGDDRELAFSVRGERERGDDPMPLDRLDQLGHALVREVASRVEALPRPDLGEGHHG